MFNFWCSGRAIWAKNINQNAWKRPPKSSNNIMFNYVQLLMTANGLKPSKSSKNEMLVFGLHSTSDDRPSDLSKKRWPKHKKNKKGLLSHWKIKCSFLDYVQLLMISRAIWAKNINQNTKKTQKCPLSHQKIKCLFLDYIQLLMIGWAIRAKNVDQNAKKTQKRPPKSSKNKMFIFGLHSTSDVRPSDLGKKCQLKGNKTKKPPKVIKR